jgi:hypothetical protein
VPGYVEVKVVSSVVSLFTNVNRIVGLLTIHVLLDIDCKGSFCSSSVKAGSKIPNPIVDSEKVLFGINQEYSSSVGVKMTEINFDKPVCDQNSDVPDTPKNPPNSSNPSIACAP